jgi:hypothetical protein
MSVQRDNKAAEFARKEAERERAAGIDHNDSAGRYLTDAEAGRTYRALTSPAARWRRRAPTAAQLAMLRKLGINPLSVRSRGEAADKIDAVRQKNGVPTARRPS